MAVEAEKSIRLIGELDDFFTDKIYYGGSLDRFLPKNIHFIWLL